MTHKTHLTASCVHKISRLVNTTEMNFLGDRLLKSSFGVLHSPQSQTVCQYQMVTAYVDQVPCQCSVLLYMGASFAVDALQRCKSSMFFRGGHRLFFPRIISRSLHFLYIVWWLCLLDSCTSIQARISSKRNSYRDFF